MTDFAPDFDEVDVAAMRKDGSLREFLRLQSRPTRRPEERGVRPVWRPPDRRPGAWPPGTSPPSAPVPAATSADWADALAVHRAWSSAHDHTDPDTARYRCDCGTCPPPEGARP